MMMNNESPDNNKTTVASSSGSVYLLQNGIAEEIRLERQHSYLVKSVTSGRLIYDTSIKLDEGDRVLDSGTGAGSWALDLSRQASSTIHITGVDISTNHFPKIYPPNLTFVQTPVTCLPPDWTSQFKFVHQRLLATGILTTDWPLALSEIYRVLKPGGSVQLVELDTSSWPQTVEPEIKIYTSRLMLFERTGLSSDIGRKLPKLLQDAGFVEIQSEIKQVPLGKYFGKEGIVGTASFIGAWRAMKKQILKADFGLISSDEEYESLLDAMARHWDTQESGSTLPFILVRATKPPIAA